MDPFIGEIRMFGGTYAPSGWAFCDGSILSIAQNSALFSLLGTQYGGNGMNTFGLPDLRGRVPVGQGQGPGLSPRSIGEMAGTESHTLINTEMPAHVHTLDSSNGVVATLNANSGDADTNAAAPEVSLATVNTGGRGATQYPTFSSQPPNTNLAPNSVKIAGNTTQSGGSQPHNNMQPYIGINFIIALEGIFPPRG